MKSMGSVFSDADHLLLIIDLSHLRDFEDSILEKMKGLKIPVTILLNKLDLSSQEQVLPQVEFWKDLLPKAEVFVISALHKHGMKPLIERIVELLPESPPYYPKDQVTDRDERFMVSEIVRRQIFEQTKKEIPYSAEVVIESFKEVDKIIRIAGVIFVDRESQKSIIIGSEGRKIKSIGSQARIELERYFGKQIHIELFVKVDKDWRKKEEKLKKYGYLS